jgi:hypothetical protein
VGCGVCFHKCPVVLGCRISSNSSSSSSSSGSSRGGGRGWGGGGIDVLVTGQATLSFIFQTGFRPEFLLQMASGAKARAGATFFKTLRYVEAEAHRRMSFWNDLCERAAYSSVDDMKLRFGAAYKTVGAACAAVCASSFGLAVMYGPPAPIEIM